jgi:hypothetical protein
MLALETNTLARWKLRRSALGELSYHSGWSDPALPNGAGLELLCCNSATVGSSPVEG